MFGRMRGAVGLESDRDLVARVLGGDRESFGVLVGRYEHAVFAVALKVLGDRQAAEDAAQDAFVAAYENLGRLADAGTFGAWVLVIARNRAMHLVRKQPRTVPLDERDVHEAPGDGALESEEMGSVMRAL